MKKALRILAVLVLLAAGATWLATGAHRAGPKPAWPSRHSIRSPASRGISYQKKFIAGMDFLAGRDWLPGAGRGFIFFS